jgi:hypothetical protein
VDHRKTVYENDTYSLPALTSKGAASASLIAATSPVTELPSSGADRDRTDDLRLAKPALSQLSYSPEDMTTAVIKYSQSSSTHV